MLADFLNNYNTFIFDMDGVITRERQYWYASALTIREFFDSENYSGKEQISTADMLENKKEIYNEVFLNERLIGILKSKGVNSNWDLTYVTLALVIFCGGDFEKALLTAQDLNDNILNEYPRIGKKLGEYIKNKDCTRNGELWTELRDCFQEWFLGDELFKECYNREPIQVGKSGLCFGEKPIIDGDKLKRIFKALSEKGKRLCIATGRQRIELEPPLKSFGIYEYIDKNSMIGYDFVKNAEEKTGANLTKPHPYMFVKAYFGADYSDEKIASGDYPKDGMKKTLAVGDAAADILSAHGGGMDFCAVLTGVSGKAARKFFEENNAEFILDSLEYFLAE